MQYWGWSAYDRYEEEGDDGMMRETDLGLDEPVVQVLGAERQVSAVLL